MIGDVVDGKWRIVRPLSSGGMGSVYVAVHESTGREVALKVIKASALGVPISEDLVARFKCETRALASISHPNVVTFLDSGVLSDGSSLFLVMELLSGKPLREEMSHALPWRRALRIGVDVARALAGAHAAGLVHRDLKPENIFLQSSAGHEDFAKLIDFGIVRLQGAPHPSSMNAPPSAATVGTMTGAVVGTPGYISPEQLSGHDATVRSDLYALGVILFELITGTFPFAAPTLHAMIVKQLMEETPRASSRATIPPDVDDVIRRLMDREPTKRPDSALDTVALLTELLERTVERPALMSALPPSASTETAVAVEGAMAHVDTAPAATTSVTQTVPLLAAPSPAAVKTRAGQRAAFALGAIAIVAIVLVAFLDSSTFKDLERGIQKREQQVRNIEGHVKGFERHMKSTEDVSTLLRATAAYIDAQKTGAPISDGDRLAYVTAYKLAADAAVEAGDVVIGSDPPGADVKIDDELRGKTPMYKVHLEPGEHVIEVGGQRQRVTAVKGQGLNVWFDLPRRAH